ncbi:hypothetical protein ABZP36_028984 [Zizania latifolia]
MSLLLTLFVMSLASTAASLIGKPGCNTTCGGVTIPYPFGIATEGVNVNCFLAGFEISCPNNNVPVLANTDIKVLNLRVMPRPDARVELPVAWTCYNSTGSVIDASNGTVDLNRTGVYRISDACNELVVLGCNTEVYTNSGPGGNQYQNSFYTGCISYCKDSRSAQDDKCAGVGCCHVEIPPDLTDNWMRFQTSWSHANMTFSPCDYAFFVVKGHYKFKVSNLRTMKGRSMPVLLDWAIRSNISNMSCAEATTSHGYACKSQLSECVNSTNGPGYFCSCTNGYEGNPYIDGGCTSISLGISLLIFTILFTLMMRQKRRMNEYFKKNGGSILQKVENIKIFTNDELNKITRNNSEILGKGGFGKVYKGTLADNTMVAVKESIEINEAQKEDFTNEVIIQSQMIHTNIIKLLGCCLEAYKQENSGRAIFDKEIATEESMYILEEISRLAMECLKENVEERPDMNEVAERLVILRRARKHSWIRPQHLEDIPKLSFSTADINTNSSATMVSAQSTPASKEFLDRSIEMDAWHDKRKYI